MSNMSIMGWPAYDTFLIVSLSGRPVYDPNPLRSNPNPKKPVSDSCHVRGLGWTLTPLIILSKYFKKTKERLTYASGGKMQIEFKIPNAHVCQDNTCFKTTFVLVKNMANSAILGNPFMCLLYPFVTNSEGIPTHPFG